MVQHAAVRVMLLAQLSYVPLEKTLT